MTTSTSERPDTGPGDRYNTRDVNAMPPLSRAIPLGIQHVLAMFVSNVTVPIIIAGAADLPPDQTAFMVQAAMFVAGIATLLQSLGLGPIGARLPIVMGTSFGFVPVLIPIAIGMGLPAALGAALCGGVAMALMGLFLPWFRFLFPPVVTGTFVVMLGILLMPVGLAYAGGGFGVSDFGAPITSDWPRLFSSSPWGFTSSAEVSGVKLPHWPVCWLASLLPRLLAMSISPRWAMPTG